MNSVGCSDSSAYTYAVALVRWHEGDVVRKLRNEVGWTLEQLVVNSGVAVTVINRLEMGHTKEPKRHTLTRLASAFGLTARQLTDAVPPPIDIPLAPAERDPINLVVANARAAVAKLEAAERPRRQIRTPRPVKHARKR